jgi:hypothetical protein
MMVSVSCCPRHPCRKRGYVRAPEQSLVGGCDMAPVGSSSGNPLGALVPICPCGLIHLSLSDQEGLKRVEAPMRRLPNATTKEPIRMP